MKETYIKAKKIVTVSEKGTITDGIIAVNEEGKITAVGKAEEFDLTGKEVLDFQDYVITPGLIDCHSHLMEYAAASLHPVTEHSYPESIRALMLHALSCGITSIGDHICGFPGYFMDYRKCLAAGKEALLRVVPALCTITLGTEPTLNFDAVDGNQAVAYERFTDPELLKVLIQESEFAGENVFITATPANSPLDQMPTAGKLVYRDEDLKKVCDAYHQAGKKIGAHVGGPEGIDQALKCGVDILHHGHGITNKQAEEAAAKGIPIVDTPLGGTHLPPRKADEFVELVNKGILMAVATDAYLPAPEGFEEEGLIPGKMYGPEALMAASHPAMKAMKEAGYDENQCLAVITKNSAKILGLENSIGQIKEGYIADLTVSSGVPGLEVFDTEKIKAVFKDGKMVICR